ncbi:MAG: hypothetical protein AAF518_08810, partial [Spirochaetota bacterium]
LYQKSALQTTREFETGAHIIAHKSNQIPQEKIRGPRVITTKPTRASSSGKRRVESFVPIYKLSSKSLSR